MSERLSLGTGRALLDFTGGGRGAISESDADQQLSGAVALHNLLHDQGVAYLADEVGMGKTYVALGAIALFRHFQPHFRVLVIAPRQNIQDKWMKEWRNFVSRVVRVEDLRIKGIGGVPARALVKVDSLVDLVTKASHDPDRDFFARLTSFSLPQVGTEKMFSSRRKELLQAIPWLRSECLNATLKDYKRNFARAVNCALPDFDLVVVDEGHNLKAGWKESRSSVRNAVVACSLGGRHVADEWAAEFRGYKRRSQKVLFLSATPIEDDFRQLWNQLDLFGFGADWQELLDKTMTDDERRRVVHRLLIRRTAQLVSTAGPLTKTEYRTEWRGGGIQVHDEPLALADDRQRLAVALVQKKVAELIGNAEHKHSFQVGLLASFESFLETATSGARAKAANQNASLESEDDAEEGLFHRSTDEVAASREAPREGVDVNAINRIARDYYSTFSEELPHPKMDALVDELAKGFETGRKSLVFVRRVASVDELQRKLEDKYDQWLFRYLRDGLVSGDLRKEINGQMELYSRARAEQRHRLKARDAAVSSDDQERSSVDSFFAWFFRGEGPAGVRSGASLAEQLDKASGNYATLFEDNYVASVLEVAPAAIPRALSERLKRPEAEVLSQLAATASSYIKSKKMQQLERFNAFQIAGLQLLARHGGNVASKASIVEEELFGDFLPQGRIPQTAADARRWLTQETFFTALRARNTLQPLLWPEPDSKHFREALIERERRRQMLASMIRKGHPIIDLFILVANRIGTLRQRARETVGEDGSLANDLLDLLEKQRRDGPHRLSSFNELSQASDNYHLIAQLNIPQLDTDVLKTNATELGRLLRAQRPIGGMAGTVNSILVRQFRMPGYPLILISTDLLKEGEDLHTFCSNVLHYGIAWMPSELEQRVGRVDRVGSHTARRLASLGRAPKDADKLQVYYPHLRDTVEVLQLSRVYERLNRFLRIMHEGLGVPEREQARVDVAAESLKHSRDTQAIKTPLRSAFGVTEAMTSGKQRRLDVSDSLGSQLRERFFALEPLLRQLGAQFLERRFDHQIVGEFVIGPRVQPFTLLLRSFRGHAIVRCVSPIGRIDTSDWDDDAADKLAQKPFARVSVEHNDRFDAYDVAVEGDVLLSAPASDAARVKLMLTSIIGTADIVERDLLHTDQALAAVAEEIGWEVHVER